MLQEMLDVEEDREDVKENLECGRKTRSNKLMVEWTKGGGRIGRGRWDALRRIHGR